MREDYSADGEAWDYFDYDQARGRAYRWSEDGLGGICDSGQRLCLALALWNGRDPYLKERAFGLTSRQGNHGEDVKECYFYRDATPSHSYLRYLYKYPQAPFPYARLIEENARRGRTDPPFGLIDTGVFADNRYWDLEVFYAKATPDEVHVRIYLHNRGPEAATVHLLPTLWFRNTWSWGRERERPSLTAETAAGGGRLGGAGGAPGTGDLSPLRGPARDAPVHGERVQRPAPLGQPQRRALRQGRLPPPGGRGRRRRRQSGPHRHQVRRLVALGGRRRGAAPRSIWS